MRCIGLAYRGVFILAVTYGCNGQLVLTEDPEESGGSAGASVAQGGSDGEPISTGGSASGSSGGIGQAGSSTVEGGEANTGTGGVVTATGGQPGTGGAGGDPGIWVDGGEPSTGGAGGEPSTGGTCRNGEKDGSEADIDCGGASCSKCTAGALCNRHVDCDSGICRGGLCQASACDDGLRNGDEEGVDCGGSCAIDFHHGNCPVTVTSCACATSAALQPIVCGADQVPDQAYLDATGSAAALALCDGDTCDAQYWSLAAGLTRIQQAANVGGISANGGTVAVNIGFATNGPALPPFLWTPSGNRTDVPGESILGMSADASVVLSFDMYKLLRWTATGTVVRGAVRKSYNGSGAMSRDGQFIAAVYHTELGVAPVLAMLDASGAEEDLAALPPGSYYPGVRAISDEGTAIAAIAYDETGTNPTVYRWTRAGGLVFITRAPDAAFEPALLSADGSVLLGTRWSSSGVPASAYRWTQADGLVDFANAPTEGSVLKYASADASVAVGFTLESPGHPAFAWDETHGLRALRSVLEQAQANLQGWELGEPLSISSNGRVVLGQGTCAGAPAIYRVVLP